MTDDEWDDHSVGSRDPADQRTGAEEGRGDVDDHSDPEDSMEHGLRLVGIGGGVGGGGRHSKIPVNDIAYDEGNDDSDEESVGGVMGATTNKSLGFRVSESVSPSHPTSSAAGAGGAPSGDNSPSTRNPMMREL